MPGLSTPLPLQPQHAKATGWLLYRDVLRSPKYVVAPMVDQSELAWRVLSRRYGAQLIYTPMINAKIFMAPSKASHRDAFFDIPSGEEGSPSLDRPLVVQFCGNDPETLLQAAKVVEDHCDAIDINLGCPQDIAKRGKYGSFLMEDWDLIYKLVNILHVNLKIPVTAKFRVFPTVEKTVAYAKMLESAGAQILTCHSRLREQRGQRTGLADWEKIRAVKEAVSVPVFANGNILFHSDIERCLVQTGADALMSAEGQLYNPALFVPSASSSASTSSPSAAAAASPPLSYIPSHDITSSSQQTDVHAIALSGSYPPHADLALEYLAIARSLKTTTALSAVKGHLFKLMRPALTRETDLRDRLGRVRSESRNTREGWEEVIGKYEEICAEMKTRMEVPASEAPSTLTEQITIEPVTGLPLIPHWLAQPYFRPLPIDDKYKGKVSKIAVKESLEVDVFVGKAEVVTPPVQGEAALGELTQRAELK
ncbi:Dus-domain-containing protein [Coniophora puteana RWD-64-598 SS2]|uniref:tRNA-dihydrouridine(16/17) synthase [NAD(P)(+)] n=1 Tax=Coniophora puteana (strain RWD-64-598) TaxID=741705 RepID=R7SD01_CONPW|nr:Dus-domain-containing protein [Coniophora puteana RWD-64-598 SS2]EIW74043.1 Dus-domain-containing protein [Coniophora puteana RWD-64-598 SS2]